MPVEYTKAGGQGHEYQVPDYPEASDGPKAFKDFADYLDLILPPVGTIMPYVGNSAPTGWLLCDGDAASSSPNGGYPKLAALCGVKFGTAPAGFFRLPNLKGRSIVGLDTQQTEFDTIGKSQGAKTVTLTTSNMPSHNHSAANLSLSGLVAQNGGTATTGGDHQHTYSGTTTGTGEHAHLGTTDNSVVTNVTSDNSPPFERGTGTNLSRVNSISVTKNAVLTSSPASGLGAGAHNHTFSGTTVGAGGHTHTISGTVSGTVSNSGDGTAFSVLNPYITLNHIIRAA